MGVEIRDSLMRTVRVRIENANFDKQSVANDVERLHNGLVQARAERLALSVFVDDAEAQERIAASEKAEDDALELVRELFGRFEGWEPLPTVQLWSNSDSAEDEADRAIGAALDEGLRS